MPPAPPLSSFLPPEHVPLKERAVPHVKHLSAVSSGKGGVGKSTLATSIAFALALRKERPRVGLLDLDVFGPSLPTLLGLLGGKGKGKQKEDAEEEDDFLRAEVTPSGALKPLTAHALPIMSMGFLVPPNRLERYRLDALRCLPSGCEEGHQYVQEARGAYTRNGP